MDTTGTSASFIISGSWIGRGAHRPRCFRCQLHSTLFIAYNSSRHRPPSSILSSLKLSCLPSASKRVNPDDPVPDQSSQGTSAPARGRSCSNHGNSSPRCAWANSTQIDKEELVNNPTTSCWWYSIMDRNRKVGSVKVGTKRWKSSNWKICFHHYHCREVSEPRIWFINCTTIIPPAQKRIKRSGQQIKCLSNAIHMFQKRIKNDFNNP